MESSTPALEVKSQASGGQVRLPPICGDFNMRIDRNGTWYYQNSPIGRIALAKLFSTVLRRDEEGTYWLTTLVENGRIEVEDVPFIAVELTREGVGKDQVVWFRTNLDDTVTLGPAHPLRMAPVKGDGEPAPYIRVRANLEARLARSVYYHLIELCEPAADDPDVLGLWSSGHFYPIGRTTDAGQR